MLRMYRMQWSVEQLAVSKLFHSISRPFHPEIGRRTSFDLAGVLNLLPPQAMPLFVGPGWPANLPYLPYLALSPQLACKLSHILATVDAP